MNKITLQKDYRGFEADTEFERVAEYGSWHVSAAKLETIDSTRRLEVTDEELTQFFAA
ncbi:hypothetical protein [Salinigranum halophilum]|uniref:hypothetical protein n=1 Tax=Salinigranum halophilum TaxID=2565931 RepID=UPI0013756D3D|nr:hypothetical protein [Salinigranum halophilum]